MSKVPVPVDSRLDPLAGKDVASFDDDDDEDDDDDGMQLSVEEEEQEDRMRLIHSSDIHHNNSHLIEKQESVSSDASEDHNFPALHYLRVRCTGQIVQPKANFGLGALSQLYVMAVSSQAPKNEKRMIRMLQSAPFVPHGRPPSLIYKTVYESELIEDSSDVSPSLIACINCPPGMDCRIQVNVYYSSNRTAGHEVLVSGLTVTLLELLNSLRYQGEGGMFNAPMISKYCPRARTIIELYQPFPNILANKALSIVAPMRQTFPRNPIAQLYTFYNRDIDLQAPVIDMLEASWEPRLALKVPQIFIANAIEALERSIQAWKERYHLERMRQGRFISSREAIVHGWNELRLTIHSASVVSLSRQQSTAVGARAGTIGLTTLRSIQEQDAQKTQHGNLDIVTVGSTTRSAVSQLSRGTLGEKLRKQDESLPSVYIKANIVDSHQTFLSLVCQTNTEYFNCYPVFGSNVNAAYARKAIRNPICPSDAMLECKTKMYSFLVENQDGSSTSGDGEDEAEGGFPDSSMQMQNIISVKGEEHCIIKYFPHRNTRINFEVYVEDANHKGFGIPVGLCSLPLNEAYDGKPRSYPFQLYPEYIYVYDPQSAVVEISLEVFSTLEELGQDVKVHYRPEGNNFLRTKSMTTIFKAPCAFPVVAAYKRSAQGDDSNKDRDKNNDTPIDDSLSAKAVIADCYEWLWHIGYLGKDPMSSMLNLAPGTIGRDEREDFLGYSKSMFESSPPGDLVFDKDDNNDDSIVFKFEDTKSNDDTHQQQFTGSNPMRAKTLSLEKSKAKDKEREREREMARLSTKAPAKPSKPCKSVKMPKEEVETRVDCRLSLPMMEKYIRQLEDIMSELSISQSEILRFMEGGITFRPSTLKKQREVQSMPINMHYQLMITRKCIAPVSEQKAKDTNISNNSNNSNNGNNGNNGNTGAGTPANNIYVDAIVTCGSMSPHALGHKKGGLYHQEFELWKLKAQLDVLKTDFNCALEKEGISEISTDLPCFESSQELSERLHNFEFFEMEVAKRRIYALSQALSIAVNSFLLKLAMVTEGFIEHPIAEGWLTHGFLVIFEGLLSVTGNEKSMLEDTMSAVDALKHFQVTILPSPRPSDDYNQEGDDLVDTDIIRESNATAEDAAVDLNVIAASIGMEKEKVKSFSKLQLQFNPSAGFTSMNTRKSLAEVAKVSMRGRLISLYLPEELFEKLPARYGVEASEGGAVVPLHAVLFSQGIDLQQTMATTFAGVSANILQSDINMKGLFDLQNLSTRLFPITSSSSDRSVSLSKTSVASNDYLFASTAESVKMISNDYLKDCHPQLQYLRETILKVKTNEKNTELLVEVDRVCTLLNACKVTFCKSGKDRTGMIVTYDQSRRLGEQYRCGNRQEAVIARANDMRLHGCRLKIAEKNIGKKVYSINKLQAQFLPQIYRPPAAVCEDMIKKGGDNS